MRSRLARFLLLLCSCGYMSGVQAQLSSNYYATSCPNVERIANTWFIIGIAQNLLAPASLIRLAFHDCAVNGCDASVLLNGGMNNTDEKLSARNVGIGNLNIIDGMKAAVERACPGVVSCSDLIVLAARDAVRFSGGPNMNLVLGRRDSKTASTAAATKQLQGAAISVNQLLSSLGVFGVTTMEAVALLGAHTMGVAHCVNIRNRLYPNVDSTLQQNAVFTNNLRAQCPASGGSPNTVVASDASNIIFDTQYFRDVLAGRGLLTIDAAVGKDPRTSPFVNQFATNSQLFFTTFQSAFTKMTRFKVLTGSKGIIRKNCRIPV
ncbi:hypothetical protein R1sor_000102 [Riccia sorocarpa]|uniref:Peroxidase n=1 Tax=Riccia sorocarpa TaxID=122646 RepID=A0ABD3GS54_9MARC